MSSLGLHPGAGRIQPFWAACLDAVLAVIVTVVFTNSLTRVNSVLPLDSMR